MAGSRFQVIKRIARGGMAEIFLGKTLDDADVAKIVAIKRILPHYGQDEEFLHMFRDEANICKRLTHANIVQVFSFEEFDESYALVMEYVDGSDLRSILSSCEKQKAKMGVSLALHIAAAIARGLHYAHTKVDDVTGQPLGIVHRDVSPQNILVSYEGEVKITDFGIADAKNKQTETKPGVVKGKYSYMSPEQVNAEIPDHRSDVFSLAIVLWEMLTMRRLFASDNEIETIKLVQNCRIPFRLRDVNPAVHPDLDLIVEKGLNKDRRRRYQSAGEFERDLQHHLNTHYPSFTPSELGGFVRKLFVEKRQETQEEIRRALSTSVKASPTSNVIALTTTRPASTADTGSHAKLGRFPTGNRVPNSMSSTGTGSVSNVSKPSSKSLTAGSFSSVSKGAAEKRRAPHSSGASRSSVENFVMSSQSSDRRISSPGTGQKARSSRSNPRIPRTKGIHVASLAALVLGFSLVVILMARRHFSAAEMPMTLYLRTIPMSVKLNIDGQDIDGGEYQQTPMRLTMPAGSHKLRIMRHGYLPEFIDIDGASGSTFREDRVVLRKSPRATFQTVHLGVIPVHARIPFTINDGFVEGEAPMTIVDLEANRTHMITFFPSGDRRRGPPFRCSMVTTAGASPTTIRIDVSNRQNPRCTVVPNN